ncbi:hypothetical protein RAM_23495 [Amycolatopsis mediterranei S699]|uniref:Uncharacterized protein n=1 Tax=Amycolatopsis mediterranei (strain S699) TaxID=713604 RepID=A0A9R0U9T3_AMYMS|nr:hypothetical protein RAM_23495 [Amycolatopsis mediterranei S699]
MEFLLIRGGGETTRAKTEGFLTAAVISRGAVRFLR